MNLSKFSERLGELIFYAQKTQEQVAFDLNCAQSSISRYLSGRALPTLETAVSIADYFNCSVDFLLGLKSENEGGKFNACPPFGERLLQICSEKGISRYRLQKLTNISESVIRYWVQGKTSPSLINVALIAEKLEISVDYLLGREK